MKTEKLFKMAVVLFAGISLVACNSGDTKTTGSAETKCNSDKTCCMKKKEPYTKKYTNADFYKDGKLDPEVALKAYLDMFDYYGIPYTDFLKQNLWITDFNLGDFENVGMAGVFWINDSTHNYFGHEIYLLPSQMIVEHRHVPTNFAAKFETWQVRNGSAYNFGIGDATPNPPTLPESQKGHITVANFHVMQVGDISSLKEIESPHFLMAGPEGVVITEYGSYHDGNGLRFTNPKTEFIDVLTAK